MTGVRDTGSGMRTTLGLLRVPPQPRWNVGAQTAIACEPCARSFIDKAGLGEFLPAPALVLLPADRFCRLAYDGVCECPRVHEKPQ